MIRKSHPDKRMVCATHVGWRGCTTTNPDPDSQETRMQAVGKLRYPFLPQYPFHKSLLRGVTYSPRGTKDPNLTENTIISWMNSYTAGRDRKASLGMSPENQRFKIKTRDPCLSLCDPLFAATLAVGLSFLRKTTPNPLRFLEVFSPPSTLSDHCMEW